jgi:hypothetical protein
MLVLLTAAGGLLAACSTSHNPDTTHTRCGGEVCVEVVGHGATVGDVIGYFRPGGNSVANRTWRLMLSAYDCNPDTQHSTPCVAAGSYPAPTHLGNPPVNATCTVKKPPPGVPSAAPTCATYLAEQLATFGDWRGFYAFDKQPHTFSTATWLCVTAELESSGSWYDDPAPGSSRPSRACSEVSP